jgi:hypothetical protein
MLGFASYLLFLGILAFVMRVALKGGRDRTSTNTAAAMLSARVH